VEVGEGQRGDRDRVKTENETGRATVGPAGSFCAVL
jgi:hypothetical protein